MAVTEPTSGVPVWARKRRRPANPLFRIILIPLAVLGALTAGLAVREKSFAAGGLQIDAWVAVARQQTHAFVDQASEKRTASKGDEQAG